MKANELRIWTKEELATAEFGYFYKNGDFHHYRETVCIYFNMYGQSLEWCKKYGYNVSDWMIAKPTQQEPKEGDLVYVWDEDRTAYEPTERIFIAKTKYGCVTVDKRDKINYQRGQSYRLILWKHYEPITLTAKEIADKVGLSLEELREIVNW